MDASSAAHGVVKGLVREVRTSVASYIFRMPACLRRLSRPNITATKHPQTIALFGPGRCMFASNFPVDKLLVASLESLEGLVAAQHALVRKTKRNA